MIRNIQFASIRVLANHGRTDATSVGDGGCPIQLVIQTGSGNAYLEKSVFISRVGCCLRDGEWRADGQGC